MATAQELIDRVRIDYLSDVFTGYDTATQEERDASVIWTDTRLMVLLNDAYHEACIRAEILTDDPAPFKIKVIAGKNGYKISHRISQLDYVHLQSENLPDLQHVSRVDMEDNGIYPDFRTVTGTPTHYWMHGYTMYLYPTPVLDDVLIVEGYALPEDLGSGDEPLIPLAMHKDLIWWVLAQCYSLNDADGYDSKRADMYEAKFNRAFGPPIDHRVITHQLENPRSNNFIGGINYIGGDSRANNRNRDRGIW